MMGGKRKGFGTLKRAISLPRRFHTPPRREREGGISPSQQLSVVVEARGVGVQLHVRDEAAPVAEGLRAEGALVGLLARVLAHVDAQVVLADEGGRADAALEGLLARVAPQVPRQVVLQAGRVRAEVAREGPPVPPARCCCKGHAKGVRHRSPSSPAEKPSPSNCNNASLAQPLGIQQSSTRLLGDLHQGPSSTDRGLLECG